MINKTLMLTAITAAADNSTTPFLVSPSEVRLAGNLARAQLVVTRTDAAGQIGERSEDLTHGAAFQSSDPNVVVIDSRGQLLAKGNGSAKVVVKFGDVTKEVAITVEKVEPVAKVGYVEHVAPILNKAGCSMGACHAAQPGDRPGGDLQRRAIDSAKGTEMPMQILDNDHVSPCAFPVPFQHLARRS